MATSNQDKDSPAPKTSAAEGVQREDERDTSTDIRSHDSQLSIGFAGPTIKSLPGALEQEPEADVNALIDLYSMTLFSTTKTLDNIFCLAVVCDKHNRIALQVLPNKCFFLPHIIYREKDTFEDHYRELVTTIIADVEGQITKPQMIDLYRFKRPRTDSFYTRYIFFARLYPLEGADGTSNCCKNQKTKLIWLNAEQLTKGLKNDTNYSGPVLWGNEPLKILHSNQTLRFREVTKTDVINVEELLFKLLDCTPEFAANLFDDYLCVAHPSNVLTFAGFVTFCGMLHRVSKADNSFRNSFPLDKVGNLYNSFKFNDGHFLSFQELICGFLAMDKKLVAVLKAPATAENKETRHYLEAVKMNYIFRFYDSNLDGLIKPYEILQLLNEYVDDVDSNNVKDLPESLKNTQKRFNMVTKAIEKYGRKDSKKDYVLNYLQARQVLIEVFTEAKENVSHLLTVMLVSAFNFVDTFSEDGPVPSAQWLRVKPCGVCSRIKYTYTNQLVRLSMAGWVTNVHQIDITVADVNLNFVEHSPESSIALLASDMLIRIQNVYRQLKGASSREEKLIDNWFFQSKQLKIVAISRIVEEAKAIFANENRVLSLSSPCFVVGGLQGDLEMLLTYGKHIWRTSPYLNHSNYLFLGNYINLGQFSLEVVCMLFCLKIIAPNNFHLLRGNTEIRQMQLHFYKECGNHQLWSLINQAFDCLPVGALVDKRYFCSFGGVPKSVLSLVPLLRVPNPLSNPYNCPPVWELL